MNTGFSSLNINYLAVNGEYIFASTSAGVFYSTNNGLSWSAMNSGFPTIALSQASFGMNDSYIYAGTQSFGVWKRLISDKYINVTPASLSIDEFENSTAVFNINANTSWILSSSESWLTGSPNSGSDNGSILLTAQANSITASRIAYVTVSGTDAMPKIVTVTQNGVPTSVGKTENSAIKIYPNPVKNILYYSGVVGNTRISIYDIMGNLIKCNRIADNQIDVSDLKYGIYTIKFETEEGIVIDRFVKQ
jgi:hypothetical protein